VILAHRESAVELRRRFDEDPFVANGFVRPEIVEVSPDRVDPDRVNAPDRIRTCDLRFRRTVEGGAVAGVVAPMRPGCDPKPPAGLLAPQTKHPIRVLPWLGVEPTKDCAEPEIAELPEGWNTLESGAPAPNWVAAVVEARRDIERTDARLAGNDDPREYPRQMPRDRDNLKIVAAGRRKRLQSNGRPRFDLTDAEIERSTQTAMRLADASKSQAEARATAGRPLSA
jgi:hypothetical protein